MSIEYRFIGVDGSVWDLSKASSIVRLVEDPEGIDGGPTSAAWQENVGQGGSTYKGQQDKIVQVKARYRFGGFGWSRPELLSGASAWRRALGKGDQVGELHVIESDDDDVLSDRWLWVRNLDAHQGPPRRKLLAQGAWNQGAVTLTSGGSRWNSAPVEVPATSGGVVENVGDFDAWPQWVITAPTTGLKVGIGTEAVALNDLTAGQTYTIDTDPMAPRVHLNGVDAWASAVGRFSWRRPVKAGETVPINIVGTAASVTVTLPVEHQVAIG